MTSLRHLAMRLAQLAGVALAGGAIAMFVGLAVGPWLGGYRTLTVLTGSMAPDMPAGSLLVVVPGPLEEVAVGDVISYHAPVEGRPVVTHRVIEVVEPGEPPVVRTKGDASTAADPWLARLEGDRAWTVRSAVPVLGRVIHHLRHPWVRQGTVLVVPALLAVLWLRDIWRRDPLPPSGTEEGLRRAPV